MTANEDRAQQIDFTDAYYVAGQSLLVKNDSTLKGINDLAGKTVCSVRPMLKLPRPSKLRGSRPRKSRIRGMATLISRSRNSNMRWPRRVTLAPINWPGCPMICGR